MLRLLLLIPILAACTTAATLRPGRTLDEGQIEVTAGVAYATGDLANPVVNIAYGVTDSFELDLHSEGSFTALQPRLQVLDNTPFDLTLMTEIGISNEDYLVLGASAVAGKRFGNWEPYGSLHYRHIQEFGINEDSTQPRTFDLVTYGSFIHLKAGCRYRFCEKWLASAEVGPTFHWTKPDSRTYAEVAIGLAREF